jgi:hypothetical protein
MLSAQRPVTTQGPLIVARNVASERIKSAARSPVGALAEARDRDGGSRVRTLEDPTQKKHITSVNSRLVGAEMILIGASSTASCAAAAPVANFR